MDQKLEKNSLFCFAGETQHWPKNRVEYWDRLRQILHNCNEVIKFSPYRTPTLVWLDVTNLQEGECASDLALDCVGSLLLNYLEKTNYDHAVSENIMNYYELRFPSTNY